MKNQKTKAFGVKTSFQEADVILIPAPWQATASYLKGTGKGPQLIREASSQLDFFNPFFGRAYHRQIHFSAEDPLIISLNKQASDWAKGIQKKWEEDKILNQKEKALSEKVNQASESLIDWLYERSVRVLQKGKIPALVGGEHSVSEALIRAVGENLKGQYGLLVIDAHADLRPAYQGFKRSHASIMHNVLNLDFSPLKMVQVGVRDFCEEEYQQIQQDSRIHCFFDGDISSQLFSGGKWADLCRHIIGLLPSEIYISLDVDGLSWTEAPGVGTPVPGGLSFNQVIYLFSEIQRQNKKLMAFDVVETSPGKILLGKTTLGKTSFAEWNGNVSARLIYYLSGLALLSQKKLKSV